MASKQPSGLPEPVLRALRARREELGLSLRELARRAGLSASYLSLVENGKRSPDVEAAGALAAALELPAAVRAALLDASRLRRRGTTLEDARRATASLGRLEEYFGRPADVERYALAEESVAYCREPGVPSSSSLGTPGGLYETRERGLASAPCPSRRAPEPRALRVPLVAELHLPAAGEPADAQLWIDPDVLPGGEPVIRPFAWRLGERGVARLRDVLAPGDVVVLSRTPPPGRAADLAREDVWLVRPGGPLVLTRVLWKGDRLVLLAPPRGDVEPELVEVCSPSELPAILPAKVVAAIRTWGAR